MAAPTLLNEQPIKKLPIYTRPRRKRPDHNVLQWIAAPPDEKGGCNNNIIQSEYRKEYQRGTQPYRRRDPITHPSQMQMESGSFADEQSTYRETYIPLQTERPSNQKRTESLDFWTDYCKPASTYRDNYPAHQGLHKPLAYTNRGDHFEINTKPLESETTQKASYLASWQEPRQPISNERPYKAPICPMDCSSSNVEDFTWKYQPPRSSYRPREVAVIPSPFDGDTTHQAVYKTYPPQAYLDVFVAEDNWETEKKAKPRYLRSPASGQLGITARGRKPPSPEVPLIDLTDSSKYKPIPVQAKYLKNGSSKSSARLTNYTTTYGDDFRALI